MDYLSEYQVGAIPDEFKTSSNDDLTAVAASHEAQYRLYKIDRQFPEGDATRGLDRWSDWPGDLGAPFRDINGNGVWDPGIDLPEFTGNQMVWTVCNDANNSLHAAVGATAPMGFELHCLYAAFNVHGVLDSAMLIRWTVINKSDAHYENIYLGLWSDPDLGDPYDDLPGCDTTLNLGYVYNEDSLDIEPRDLQARGYGLNPPAVGFQMLEGPTVKSKVDDTARFRGRLVPGKRNLTGSSFIFYDEGWWAVGPPDGTGEYANIAYDYLRGKIGTRHENLVRPDGSIVYFWLSGDPVTGTGDLPENFPFGGVLNGGDMRIMLNTGPFELARGDTQEVVAAVVLARGKDRLESVTQLKARARFIRDMFDNDYQFLNVPDEPSVTAPETEPLEFYLSQNSPHPFNPGTRLEYELPEPASVRIRVYDCFGRELRTLVRAQQSSGVFSVEWDGTDAGGIRAASGLYIARFEALRADGTMRILTRKMILLR